MPLAPKLRPSTQEFENFGFFHFSGTAPVTLTFVSRRPGRLFFQPYVFWWLIRFGKKQQPGILVAAGHVFCWLVSDQPRVFWLLATAFFRWLRHRPDFFLASQPFLAAPQPATTCFSGWPSASHAFCWLVFDQPRTSGCDLAEKKPTLAPLGEWGLSGGQEFFLLIFCTKVQKQITPPSGAGRGKREGV